jgi:type VII secretion-associated serine protease mycosin
VEGRGVLVWSRWLAGVATAALVAAGVVIPVAPAWADEIRDRQYWISQYGIDRAWEVTRGAGVTIAIIDTGVDSTHKDLQGAVTGGTDVSGIGSANGQTPVGRGSEHGTLVASLAAGRGHSGNNGVIGAAPEANILSVSMAFEGASRSADEQIARAVRWSVDNGADIISLSLTRNTREWPTSWDDAFSYAESRNVVVIAAAGNRGSGTEAVGAPATMPGVLTVGGVTRSGAASTRASSQGITIGVMAASENLVGAVPGDRYALWDGTSGATPIVAGIAALVRAAHPELDAANVINRILQTARPQTDRTPDPLYGYGIVDAFAAVTNDVPRVSTNPLGTLAEWIVVYRRGEGERTVIEFDPISLPATEDAQAVADMPHSVDEGAITGLPYAMVLSLAVSLSLVVFGAIYQARRVKTVGRVEASDVSL